MYLRDREMGLRGTEDKGRREVLQDEKENGAKGLFEEIMATEFPELTITINL